MMITRQAYQSGGWWLEIGPFHLYRPRRPQVNIPLCAIRCESNVTNDQPTQPLEKKKQAQATLAGRGSLEPEDMVRRQVRKANMIGVGPQQGLCPHFQSALPVLASCVSGWWVRKYIATNKYNIVQEIAKAWLLKENTSKCTPVLRNLMTPEQD